MFFYLTGKKTFFIYDLVTFALLAIMTLYFGYFLISPGSKENKEKIFIVKKGSGLKRIAADLRNKGHIKNQSLIIIMAILRG